MSTTVAWAAGCAAKWRTRRCCVRRSTVRNSSTTRRVGIASWRRCAARSSVFCSDEASASDCNMPSERPIKLTIAALGGQGGGVLANWLIGIAESEGYLAQTTSVPGVAQRTGATIYYLEFFPQAAAERAGRDPIMALMPVSGGVDCVLASELAEAGRAIQRGLVTPDRTTLISSTHRTYAIGEKSAMGQGAVDTEQLTDLVRSQAKRLVLFDMEETAERHQSVISSVLLGALCGSGV